MKDKKKIYIIVLIFAIMTSIALIENFKGLFVPLFKDDLGITDTDRLRLCSRNQKTNYFNLNMEYANPLQKPRIEKLVVNIGVGESGERLGKGEKLLGVLTNRKPIRTYSKHKIPAWGIRKGEPIGCKVTLRGAQASEVLKRLLYAKENILQPTSFGEKNGSARFPSTSSSTSTSDGNLRSFATCPFSETTTRTRPSCPNEGIPHPSTTTGVPASCRKPC